MIDRPRRQERRCSIETAGLASPETHRRRGAERDAKDMLEHRPVSVPANSGTWVVADQKGLDEFGRLQAGELRRLHPQRQQPIGNRHGWGEAGIVEVVTPAVGGSKPLS
jgi:hypothetical protein